MISSVLMASKSTHSPDAGDLPANEASDDDDDEEEEEEEEEEDEQDD